MSDAKVGAILVLVGAGFSLLYTCLYTLIMTAINNLASSAGETGLISIGYVYFKFVFVLITATIGLVAGFLAWKPKKYQFVIFGTIMTIVSGIFAVWVATVIGIIGLVFIIRAKDEFYGKTKDQAYSYPGYPYAYPYAYPYPYPPPYPGYPPPVPPSYPHQPPTSSRAAPPPAASPTHASSSSPFPSSSSSAPTRSMSSPSARRAPTPPPHRRASRRGVNMDAAFGTGIATDSYEPGSYDYGDQYDYTSEYDSSWGATSGSADADLSAYPSGVIDIDGRELGDD